MIRLATKASMIASFKLAMIAMAGTAAGDLLEGHNVSLPTVCSVGAIVVIGSWKLSSRFTSLENRLTSIESELGIKKKKHEDQDIGKD